MHALGPRFFLTNRGIDLVLKPKVFHFGWWMGMYGVASPKRHRAYTNNKWAASLDLGVYKRALQQQKPKVETVKKYVNKKGQKAYVGTKALKSTQSMTQFVFQVSVFLACINPYDAAIQFVYVQTCHIHVYISLKPQS